MAQDKKKIKKNLSFSATKMKSETKNRQLHKFKLIFYSKQPQQPR